MKKSKGFFKFYILHSGTHTELHATCRRQRALHPIQKRHSTYRRQRDLRVHPFILQDLPKAFQTFQSFVTFSLSRQYYVHPGIPPNSTSSTNSTTYSILQLECIFYTSAGFHRNSTEYQLRHYKLSFFKEREMLQYQSKRIG